MTAITQAQFEMLISLQNIEFDKIEVQRTLNAVAARVSELENELNAFAEDVEKEKQALQATKALYNDYEEQIQTNDTLITKIEAKRRSVKTEREYQSLIKEEEQLRTRKTQIEDEMIACMDQMETLAETIAAKEKELAQIREQVAADIQSVQEEASTSESRHAELSREWEQMAAGVDGRLLDKFVKVKKQTPDGRALAPVKNAICMACHMNIPPQMYNELQRFDSLKLCPFCFRILYWDNS
ncbi:MAG: C4-type zinc ribbon domain-containing protein [Desulfobacterales bacterium]|nr:C4-type zinc ribbon domain-containing protein [Desulfobacterales bacterium]